MKYSKLILSILIAIVLLLQFYYFSKGVGLSTDGVRYLWSSENIYNGIGFFEKDKYQENLVPVTQMPPFYSILVAFTMHFTNADSLFAAQMIALFFGIGFYLVWIFFFFLLYKNINFENEKDKINAFLVASIWLVLGMNYWQFMQKVATDLVFVTLLGLVGVFFLKSLYAINRKKELISLFLVIIFTNLAILTRIVGFAFLFPIALIYLIDKRKTLKMRIINVLLYVSMSVIGFFAVLYRNSLYTKHDYVVEKLSQGNTFSVIFSQPKKIIDIINYFVVDALNMSARFETFAIVFLLGLLGLMGFILFLHKLHAKNFFTKGINWLLFSLILYVGLIIYSGTTGGHFRSSGYMRYFITIQIFVVPILVAFIFYFKNKKQKLSLLVIGFISLFSLYSFVSGVNKNRLYIGALEEQHVDTQLYETINKTLKQNDLLLSNNNLLVGYHSKRQCLHVEHHDRIRLLLTAWWEKPYDHVYFAINKHVGKTFRIGFPTYDVLLKNLPHKEILFENENYILVELDKDVIFKEAGK